MVLDRISGVMNISGCNNEMLDKISLDLTNISEQISLYLSKIEDEIYGLKSCFDVAEINRLKNHFNNVRNNFRTVESNIDKVATDMIRVKSHYTKSDSEMKITIDKAINNIEHKEVWHG